LLNGRGLANFLIISRRGSSSGNRQALGKTKEPVFKFGFLDGHGAARDSRDRGSEVNWRRPEIIGEIIEIAANSTSLMVTFPPLVAGFNAHYFTQSRRLDRTTSALINFNGEVR
jgi:hypothetical protein